MCNSRLHLLLRNKALYTIMTAVKSNGEQQLEWFAIKTRQESRAFTELSASCKEVLFLKETQNIPGKRTRPKAVIPHVLFIKTTRDKALALEREGREYPERAVSFWIYRYPQDNKIQPISEASIHLLRLLSSSDTSKCEIFNKKDFKENQHVRISEGQFKGYEGYVVRVKKNKHVVVKIEGVCMVLLPFIHPDFLESID